VKKCWDLWWALLVAETPAQRAVHLRCNHLKQRGTFDSYRRRGCEQSFQIACDNEL
jgi:hypothetical protein